jgi:hypothetical protein
MEESRAFRKGDQLRVVGDLQKPDESTVTYTVLREETAGGMLLVKITDQPDIPGRSRYFDKPYHIHASTARKYELIAEGPAKRPNTRVTKTRAGSVRLDEVIRYNGVDATIERLEFTGVAVHVYTKDGNISGVIILDTEEEVEIIGKRGRKLPPTVHFNPYAEEGVVSVKKNWRPGFGSHACGVVTLINVYASSRELVTCDQACAEECRTHHWRKGGK